MKGKDVQEGGRLSEAVAVLTARWGTPSAVRGGPQTLSAMFSAIQGPIEDIFRRAQAPVEFLNMAPQRVGGPPDMGIVSGHIQDGVAYIARVFPSAQAERYDVDIRLEMTPGGGSAAAPSQAMFEAVSQILGERLLDEGVYAQFMAHLLKGAGAHRQRFYAELAQLIADYVRDPDEAP